MKFSETPNNSHPQRTPRPKSEPLCPNKRCLLHWLRSDEMPHLRPHLYRRDTILIEQGEPVLGCYSICHGYVKVARRTVRGKVATVDIRGPGELIGARELLADEPVFDLYAQTLCETKALRLDRAYLLDLIQRRPEFLGEISRRVAQIAGTVQRRLSSALHASIVEKIAYLLSYLHEKQTFVQFGGGGRLAYNCAIMLFQMGPRPA